MALKTPHNMLILILILCYETYGRDFTGGKDREAL